MKKIIIVAFGLLSLISLSLFALVPNANAATCNGVETSVDFNCDQYDTDGVSAILMYVINFMAIGVGIAVVVGVIFGGVKYASSDGEEAKAKEGREIITNSIIGLFLFIFLYAGANFLIPGGAFNLNAKPPAVASSNTTTSASNGKAGSNTKVTAISWNVYFKNPRNVGEQVVKLLESGGDIIGLQESRRPIASISKIACAGCNYGIYPTSSGAETTNAIVWDKRRFTLVTSGAFHTVTDVDSRYIVWGKFKDISTDKTFYFINTHLPAYALNGNEWDTKGNPKQVAAYKAHMDRLTSFIKSKQADNIPILLTGDFNANYRWDKCNQSKLSCVALGQNLSVYSSYKYTGLAGIGSSNTADGVLYDYVFSWKRSDVTIGSNHIVGSNSGWGGSDHSPIFFTVTMTTAASSSSGSTTGGGGSSQDSTSLPTLSGVHNFRDTGASGYIKTGILYRSSLLRDATPSDISKLSTLLSGGVIIDLRDAQDRQTNPDPAIPNVSRADAGVTGTTDYTKFVNDAASRKAFGNALTTIANTQGKVLVHCTYGKDRTGWAVAMAMYATGASNTQVMNEYLKTTEYTVKEKWLNTGLDAARAKYGSVHNYLKEGLGLSDSTLAALKGRLSK